MYNNKRKETILFRAEVYYANLPEKENSSIQGGYRPIVIWSNDKNNTYSTVYNYYAITSQLKDLPVHVEIFPPFLPKPSMVLCEQPRTDDENDLLSYIDWEKGCVGMLSEDDMYRIFIGAAIQAGCGNYVHYFKNNQRYATA